MDQPSHKVTAWQALMDTRLCRGYGVAGEWLKSRVSNHGIKLMSLIRFVLVIFDVI
jgi:hypothetical protein